MALQIELESASGSITLETADLQTTTTTLRNRNGQRTGEEVVWRISAVISGSDAEDVAQKKEQLEEVLASEPVRARLLSDGVLLDALDESSVTEGPQIEGLEAGGDEDLRRHVGVALTLRGLLFDTTGNILETDLETEHIWEEEVYSRRVRGRVRVREGADAYSAALRYQPLLPPGARWLRRRVVVQPQNSAEFEFHYTMLPVLLPRGVSFCRRILRVEEKGGRRVAEYEAEFRGRGAEEAAERFRPAGDLIEYRIEREGEFVRVRYSVLERAEKESVVVRRFRVKGGGRAVKAVGGQNRVAVFKGGVVPVKVEERGEAVRLDGVPSVVAPLRMKDLVVAEREYEVEPESLDTRGEVVAWRMRWRFVYVVSGVVAEPGSLLVRLLSASSAGG